MLFIFRPGDRGLEDVEMATCLAQLNVPYGDSRDSKGLGRFFGILPEQLLVPDLAPKDLWFFKITYYPVEVVCLVSTCSSKSQMT